MKKLQKDTNCSNLKIKGKRNNAPAEAELNGDWIKILAREVLRKEGVLREETAAIPTGLAACTFL